MDIKYTAIILAKRDISEFDRIYTAYTKEAGKVRFVARGVRKSVSKLAGNIEPITEVELYIAKGKGKGQLAGAIALENFNSIKNNFDILRRVFYVFGILRKMISEEEKDEKVFLLLVRYLETLEKIPADEYLIMRADVVTSGVIFKLMDALGYRIESAKCVECGAELSRENNYFSMKSGGVLCQRCQKNGGRKIKVSSSTIKLLRIFSKNKLENLVKISVSTEDIKNIKLVMDEAVRWIIG